MQAECVRTWKHLPDASYGHNSDRPKPITKIGEQKSKIYMCRKSIFGDSLFVNVLPNVFHFAICVFIRPVCVLIQSPRATEK